MTPSRKPTDTPATYEQAIEQLEGIIDQIESGEAGLEQSLKDYERGMKLITHCRTILDKAEKRIAELTAEAGGTLKVTGEAEDVAEAEYDDEDDET